ncbi:MAG: 50S ribosomal protein L4 [Phycisphaeraceae bacterium]|nr:50S ribosomal protein L4 [Phycisphaeraceae bacterium]
MIEVPVHNSDGEQVETFEVDEELLGGEIRPKLLKQAFVRYHANRRQGSAATRNRGRIRGSGRKLYRQKGTGNARRGDKKTNLLRGGGVAFAKRPKSWRQKMPRQMRRLANRNALLAKLVDGEVKLVTGFGVDDKPSTAAVSGLLEKLGVDRSCLLALEDTRGNEGRSARNIDRLSVTRIDQINAFSLLNNRYLLCEKDALAKWIEHRGNGRQVAEVTDEEIAANQEA